MGQEEKKVQPGDILRELIQSTPLISVYSTLKLTLKIFTREGGGKYLLSAHDVVGTVPLVWRLLNCFNKNGQQQCKGVQADNNFTLNVLNDHITLHRIWIYFILFITIAMKELIIYIWQVGYRQVKWLIKIY